MPGQMDPTPGTLLADAQYSAIGEQDRGTLGPMPTFHSAKCGPVVNGESMTLGHSKQSSRGDDSRLTRS